MNDDDDDDDVEDKFNFFLFLRSVVVCVAEVAVRLMSEKKRRIYNESP